MIKHVVGFILFSLIFGTSAFVSGIFTTLTETVSSVTVDENYSYHGKKKKKKRRKHRHCRSHSSRSFEINATVTKAMYNARTGKFTTNVVFGDSVPETMDLDLHFYVRDEYGTRYLKTEAIEVSSWTNNYTTEFGWLSRFGQLDDLYVIPSVRTIDTGWTVPPTFSAVRAASVQVIELENIPGEMGH